MNFLNPLTNRIAEFVNQGPDRSRSDQEIFDEFKNEHKGTVLNTLGNLLSDKPIVLRCKTNSDGTVTYTATNALVLPPSLN